MCIWVRASIFAQARLLIKPAWFMESPEIALFRKQCAINLLPDAQSHENNCSNARRNLVRRPKAPHLWSDWSPSCICEWFPWLCSPEGSAPAALLGARCPRLPPARRTEVAEEGEATLGWSTGDMWRKWLHAGLEGVISPRRSWREPREPDLAEGHAEARNDLK